jgi:hypothetical protein
MKKTYAISNEQNPQEELIGYADLVEGGGKEGRVLPKSFDHTSILLGVRENWLGNTGGQTAHLTKTGQYVLANFTRKQADWREIRYTVKTVLGNMLTYAPVHSRIRAPALHQWDIQLARVVRTALKVTQTTCRQGMYAERRAGVLHMPSLVVEMVAAVARETVVALNGEGLDSVLLRETWKAAMQGKPSVVAEAVDFLAGYRLYLADSQHRTASRILCALRNTRGRRRAAMLTQPWDNDVGEEGRSTSITSPLGREVAETVARRREE